MSDALRTRFDQVSQQVYQAVEPLALDGQEDPLLRELQQATTLHPAAIDSHRQRVEMAESQWRRPLKSGRAPRRQTHAQQSTALWESATSSFGMPCTTTVFRSATWEMPLREGISICPSLLTGLPNQNGGNLDVTARCWKVPGAIPAGRRAGFATAQGYNTNVWCQVWL